MALCNVTLRTSQPGMTKNRMNAARLCASHPLGYGYSLLDKWFPGLTNQVYYYDVDVGNAARLKVGNDRGIVIFVSVGIYREIPRLCVGRGVGSSGRPSRGVPIGLGGRSLALVIVGNPFLRYVLSGFRL